MHFIHFSVNAILQHVCVLALIDNQFTNDLISFKTLLNCIENGCLKVNNISRNSIL